MIEMTEADFRARAPQVVLGPALWLFGTALWAYLVAGQLVVTQDFPEPLAAFGVLFALGAAWYFAIEHSFLAQQPSKETRLMRIFAPLGIAFLFWLATLLVGTVIGLSSNEDIDSLITLGLWLSSLIPFFVGRRMTRVAAPSPQDGARRALGILLWVGAAVVTLVALIPILK
jgi:hypothetical protein